MVLFACHFLFALLEFVDISGYIVDLKSMVFMSTFDLGLGAENSLFIHSNNFYAYVLTILNFNMVNEKSIGLGIATIWLITLHVCML